MAAVALPVGVAYAQLAGFSPVVGLYVSILPLVAYALFGTSRQLIIGPDAATCALVAAAVLPLAGGDPDRYLSLTIALTALAGLFCIAASFLRLGALADFLSKPILVGFLNGISLHILVGQIGKLTGYPVDAQEIVPAAVEVVQKFGQTHWPTLAVGLGTFVVLFVSERLLPRLPAALVALVVAGVAVAAAGLALVSFSSMMLTSRSFAARNGYDVDADREFAALGAANIAAALSQGFAVSGADSRTAMGNSAGGRTQVTGLVAAGAIAVVLLFFTDPLRYVPIAALGAVLIKASLSLLDLGTLRQLYRLNKAEFALSVLATLGVIWVGAIRAILVAVMLALLRFVRLTSRPPVEILGEVAGHQGFHSVARHPDAVTHPGLVLFRFNAPLVFFNAPYFKQQARAAIEAAGPDLEWFVVDALPLTQVDLTGYFEIQALADALRARGAELVVAGRMTEASQWRSARGLGESEAIARHFATLEAAVEAYRAKAVGKCGGGAGGTVEPSGR